MSKVLVTGGAGFIGSHTVDLLLKKGYEVIILDNLVFGTQENINKKAKFIHADLLDINRLQKKLKDINLVMHTAAQISVTDSIKNPINDLNNNLLGTLKLLEFCRKNDVEKFIFSSSAAVYGISPPLPVKEDFRGNPGSPYALSKRSAEMYLNYYAKTYGLDCISLRYSNVYGPRQNSEGEAGVITIFINQIVNGQRPIIFGDGNQTRDFIFVADVAEANVKSMEKRTSNKVFNISTNIQTSIKQLFYKICNEMKKERLRPILKKQRKGEVRFSALDNNRAKNELEWKPKIGLDEGLRSTIKWFSS